MPSYLELRQEIWWGLEFQPPTLLTLCERLRVFFNVSIAALGSKGDNNHLSGYHRSRNWIQRSSYCTNRTYSVSETTGNRAGGDPNWLCAIDITIPREQLLPMCQRLDVAVRSGRLEKVTEWYGNSDGDTRVDGYNNIQNRVATSDSSHLWHAHISFDRGRANEDHSDLYAILTGTGEDDDMTPEQAQQLKDIHFLLFTLDSAERPPESVAGKIETIRKAVTTGTPIPGEVTLSDESVAEVAEAVADEQHDRSAE